jgi:NTE family protein
MSVNDYIASHSKKSLFRSDNGTTDVCNYLNNLESENDILLYITNKTPDAWSAKCLRQADRVIVLAQSIDKDQIAEIKNRLSGFKEVSDLAKWDLVIIHPENTIINGLKLVYLKDGST